MDLPEAMRNLPPQLRLLWNLARKALFLLSPMLRMMRNAFKAGREQIMAQQKKGLLPSEYAVMEQPGRLEAFVEMFNEAMSQGVKGRYGICGSTCANGTSTWKRSPFPFIYSTASRTRRSPSLWCAG
jgi:hypothetical protein